MASNESSSFFYDPNTPPTAHEEVAALQFREFFEAVPTDGRILNVAAGYTRLGSDLGQLGVNRSVWSLDPVYKEPALAADPRRRVGFMQKVPFRDDTFDVTLCHFGFQHIPEDEWPLAMSEMFRVTRRVDDARDHSSGTVIIGPVFRPEEFQRRLRADGLLSVCGVVQPPTTLRKANDVRPAFVAKKVEPHDSEHDSDLVRRMAEAAVATDAFTPKRRELGERFHRLFRFMGPL